MHWYEQSCSIGRHATSERGRAACAEDDNGRTGGVPQSGIEVDCNRDKKFNSAPRGALFYWKRELMNIRNGWRGAMRRVAEVSEDLIAGAEKADPSSARLGMTTITQRHAKDAKTASQHCWIRSCGPTGDGAATGAMQAAASGVGTRLHVGRCLCLPYLTPGAPTLMRAGVMPKPTPANLRRFAEMPIARKAINTIKDRVAGMQWRIQPRQGRTFDRTVTRVKRPTQAKAA